MGAGSATVRTAALQGVTARPVKVEVSSSGGIPGLDIVGMPDTAVLEARSRVRCALRSSNFELPRAHITINLAPGGMRKTGTAFDLPIAVAILIATGQLPPSVADDTLFAGELALDGSVCPVRGDMAYALLAKDQGLRLVTSADSDLTGGWGSDALAVYGVLVNVSTGLGGIGWHADLPRTLTMTGWERATTSELGVTYRDFIRHRQVGIGFTPEDARLLEEARACQGTCAIPAAAAREPHPSAGASARAAAPEPHDSSDWFSRFLESVNTLGNEE